MILSFTKLLIYKGNNFHLEMKYWPSRGGGKWATVRNTTKQDCERELRVWDRLNMCSLRGLHGGGGLLISLVILRPSMERRGEHKNSYLSLAFEGEDALDLDSKVSLINMRQTEVGRHSNTWGLGGWGRCCGGLNSKFTKLIFKGGQAWRILPSQIWLSVYTMVMGAAFRLERLIT